MAEKVKVLTLVNEETGEEDKYALSLNMLGEGKSAKVYKATHMRNPNMVYAVKVIQLKSEQIKQEYLKQLNIIKSLPRCPNLVNIHKQHLESENNLYIFQEYCDKGTLVQFKTEKLGDPFTEEEVYDLFFQTCKGLINLLEAGIVHEDIKPLNILKKRNLFKLCDFGVSEIQQETKETATRKGTISYMPPEKLRSKSFKPNHKSDIFSLGTSLYEIIFGFHPYLKKRTTNYKEYLKLLDENNLRPMQTLCKRVASTSLRFENFVRFLEKMIYLNDKKRASLDELKEFLKETEPFKSMQIPEEESVAELEIREAFEENFINIYESKVFFAQETKQEELPLSFLTKEKENPHLKQLEQSMKQPQMEPQERLKLRVRSIYWDENAFLSSTTDFLMNGFQNIRKNNFENLNVEKAGKLFLKTSLEECPVSRFLKYCLYHFLFTIRGRFKAKYQNFLSQEELESLEKDKDYFDNQYRKFLIESVFSSKQDLSEELKDPNLSLQLGELIGKYMHEKFQKIEFIFIKDKLFLLSLLYCKLILEVMNYLSRLDSIFDDKPLDLSWAEEYNYKYIKQTNQIISNFSDYEHMKTEELKRLVQEMLNNEKKQVIFDFEEKSDQYIVFENQQE